LHFLVIICRSYDVYVQQPILASNVKLIARRNGKSIIKSSSETAQSSVITQIVNDAHLLGRSSESTALIMIPL